MVLLIVFCCICQVHTRWQHANNCEFCFKLCEVYFCVDLFFVISVLKLYWFLTQSFEQTESRLRLCWYFYPCFEFLHSVFEIIKTLLPCKMLVFTVALYNLISKLNIDCCANDAGYVVNISHVYYASANNRQWRHYVFKLSAQLSVCLLSIC